MVRFKCSMHTMLLLLFLPFALHLLVHYSLTNTNTILFQPLTFTDPTGNRIVATAAPVGLAYETPFVRRKTTSFKHF